MFKIHPNVYYKVNGTIVFDKIQAVLLANTTKSDITWHFHEDVFSKVNWKIEPSESLAFYYKTRAQQIREKYDYVVCMTSGGADSVNMIHSFLDNGIKIDEVVASAPVTGLSNYNFSDTDTSVTNTISETKFAQLPFMQLLSTTHPEIKLTINDYFQTILEYKSDEWLLQSADWIHPTTVARYSLDRITHLKKLAESGKKIAIVYGIEKPGIHINNVNEIYGYFADLSVNTPRPPFKESYDNVDIELFYWSPELPELVVKSTHVVLKNFFREAKDYMLRHPNWPTHVGSGSRVKLINTFHRQVIPYIYPTIPHATGKVFQAGKPTSVFMSSHDRWFYDHKNLIQNQMISSDLKAFLKGIDPKYLVTPEYGMIVLNNHYLISTVDEYNKT